MAEFDVCTLGAATLNSQTKVVTVELSRETGLDGEGEPMGTAPMLMALGHAALPIGPDDKGHAEGVLLSPCGPYTAAIIGANDTRSASVYGELAPGETAIFSTGADATKRARVFCKEDSLSLLVGNDTLILVDRKNKAINISGFGHTVEISDANGILLAESGGACLRMTGGKLTVLAGGSTFAGACTFGDVSAMPLTKVTPLVSYMTALEALLTTIGGATTPPTAPAVAAFTAAMATVKTAMATLYAKGT